jgi:hypothetical protein
MRPPLLFFGEDFQHERRHHDGTWIKSDSIKPTPRHVATLHFSNCEFEKMRRHGAISLVGRRRGYYKSHKNVMLAILGPDIHDEGGIMGSGVRLNRGSSHDNRRTWARYHAFATEESTSINRDQFK